MRPPGRTPVPRRALLGTLLVLGCALRTEARALSTRPGPAAADTPAAVVQRLRDALGSAASSPSYGERLALLTQPLGELYDFAAAARSSLGERWGGLDEARRTRIAELLSRLIPARTAAVLDGGLHASSGTWTEEILPDGGARVHANAAAEDGEEGEIAYRLEQTGGAWRIVSESGGDARDAGAPSDLAAILEREGPEALVARIEERTALYAMSPPELVTHLQEGLLEAMKRAGELGFDERRARLAPLIEETHDLRFIAWYCLRRRWSELSEEQQAEYTEVFRELGIVTYVSRFDGYSGETFSLDEGKPPKKGIALVKTTLTESSGRVRHLDYQLRRSGGRWRIINIIADGVSDLAVKRAEYDSVLKEDGYGPLIEKIRRKIALKKSAS